MLKVHYGNAKHLDNFQKDRFLETYVLRLFPPREESRDKKSENFAVVIDYKCTKVIKFMRQNYILIGRSKSNPMQLAHFYMHVKNKNNPTN